MPRTRSLVGAAALAAVLAAALAVAAQAQAPQPSATDQVKTWSHKQWNAAKREWRKDTAKWDMCNARATGQHLTRRKSWSYIYDCMKA